MTLYPNCSRTGEVHNLNTNSETQEDVNEVILIVQAIKRHLQEERCVHSIDTIVKEAFNSKCAGLAAQTQQTTDVISPRSELEQEYKEQ